MNQIKYFILAILSLLFSLKAMPCEKQKNDDIQRRYELFEIVQRMHNIIDKLHDEFDKRYLWIEGCREGIPNPYYNQTKRGLLICEDHSLYTPWGEVQITCKKGGTDLALWAFRQILFEKLTTAFHNMVMPKIEGVRAEFFELKPNVYLPALLQNEPDDWFKTYFEQVKETDLNRKKEQDVFLIASLIGFYPVYKILAVEDQILPKPELLPWKKFREYEEIKQEWNDFMIRYNKEKKKLLK